MWIRASVHITRITGCFRYVLLRVHVSHAPVGAGACRGVARGPVWVIDWHWRPRPTLKCALPKIATLGARVRHDAGTFAHEECHHRVRRGRLGLELASLPAKVSTGVRIDPLISAVSELFAAPRAAVGRMLMAPTPSIQYGKGGLLGHDFRRPLRRMRPTVCAHAWLGRFVAPATPRDTR